jgi:excisionase family DNA binding protein
MQADEIDRKLLTPAEVAKNLRVSVPTIYRAIHAGELEALRIGGENGSLRVPADAVADFVRPVLDETEVSG